MRFVEFVGKRLHEMAAMAVPVVVEFSFHIANLSSI